MDRIKILDKNFELYIPNDKVKTRIKDIANVLNEDLKGKKPLFLGILNGSFMFVGELLQNINLECEISFVKLASYSGTVSSREVKKLIGLNENIKDRTIVILEDIIDTGKTIDHIVKQLKELNPAEIFIAALFYKKYVYKSNNIIDYFCFEIPNDFIVGYGLDYNGFGRNLKHIYKITE